MEDRDDLGALFTRVSRRLIDAERPLLAARGLSMWGYIVLSQLLRGPAPTPLTLAGAIGYDKTRLIGLLDELEREGLLTRAPDRNDRRARVVHITAKGRRRHAAARKGIRAMEDEFMRQLEPYERQTLLAVLPRLAL